MAPQRDYSRSSGGAGVCNAATENSGNSGAGGGVDVKLYVALESSSSHGSNSSSSGSSSRPQWAQYNNPGYNNNINSNNMNSNLNSNHNSRPRVDVSDMNNGRCPHHVKLGDSEWTHAERPANQHQIRVPYQAELTRTYIKPPPNKTALDVPDRDNSSSGSNLLNFPYVHGMSASQEALSSPSGAAVSIGGVSKASSKQSNFPFSRFFKSRGSNTSINNNNNNASGGGSSSAKSRPESPCRYAGCGAASKSTSAMDLKQRVPLSGSSISLASTVYANSPALVDGPTVNGGGSRNCAGGMVVDVTSTNYCVYVATSSSVDATATYRAATASTMMTTTTTTTHLPSCDTTSGRETETNAPETASNALRPFMVESSSRPQANCSRGGHHSRSGSNAVHSINSYHTQQQQQQPQTVSASTSGSSSGCPQSTMQQASCDKRVYVEKRIKTSDSESCSNGGGGGGGGTLTIDTMDATGGGGGV